MAFAERGLAFSTLQICNLTIWPELEQKVEVWDELGFPIDLVPEKSSLVSEAMLKSNQMFHFFRS